MTEASNRHVKAFNSNSAFKARLAGGCQAEVEIIRQLKDIGVTLMFGPGSMPINHTNSAAAFRRSYDIVGRERLHQVLSLVKSYQRPNYDGTIERHALRPDFVVALAKLLVAKERPLKFEQLLSNLSRSYPAYDIFCIAEKKVKNGGGENRLNILVEAIRESYVRGGENTDGGTIVLNVRRAGPKGQQRKGRAA